MLYNPEYLEHVKLNPPKIEFRSNTDGDTSTYIGTITANIVARVVEKTDEVIVDAVVKEAAAEGVTDLFLIDKEFIMTAIKNEMARRKAMIIKGEEK